MLTDGGVHAVDADEDGAVVGCAIFTGYFNPLVMCLDGLDVFVEMQPVLVWEMVYQYVDQLSAVEEHPRVAVSGEVSSCSGL